MTTAQLSPAAINQPPDSPSEDPGQRARVSFRQPVSSSGFIDAAWWPRTRDLAAELPSLVDVLWTAGREINRITYNRQAWNPAPRRIEIEGRVVRLGGFTGGGPHTVRLTDAWGQERIDILVIPPDTDPAIAQRAFDIASQTDDPYRANQILDRANNGASEGSASRT